jgi:uncharacterized protein
VSGAGSVFSYIVIHHPMNPLLVDHVPYNVVVVALDEAPHCRLISNVVDAKPEDLEVGMRVQVTWEPIDDEIVLPRFCRT